MNSESTYSQLPDQRARDRFQEETDKNFSVIAPAGVGKTTSIINRVVELAREDSLESGSILPKLVVVTYTNKAADEMLSRARFKVQETFSHPEIAAQLSRSYFGTIHGFCLKLIEQAGPLIGLPADMTLVEDPESVWNQYYLRMPAFLERMSDGLKQDFQLFGSWDSIYQAVKKCPPDFKETSKALNQLGRAPHFDLESLLAFEPKRKVKTIPECKTLFAQWWQMVEVERQTAHPMNCPIPEITLGGKEFQLHLEDLQAPLKKWIKAITLTLMDEIAADFQRFRIENKTLVFDDIILLARQLLENPRSAQVLRSRGYRIILDEAQDTDPTQFTVLTELTRPKDVKGIWVEGNPVGPEPGRFSMVGDPQQSIYGQRADLNFYLAVHDRLLEAGGESLIFEVTMRCPETVVRGLNRVLPPCFKSNPVDYIELKTPEREGQGQLVRYPFTMPAGDFPGDTESLVTVYSEQFADWIQSLSLSDLGASSWGEVAIICPRTKWVESLAFALRKTDRNVQLISRKGNWSDHAVYAWFSALMHGFAHPRDSFEWYGILRDVFGFSDGELVEAIGEKDIRGNDYFRIDRNPLGNEASRVNQALKGLHLIWLDIRKRPLYEGVITLLREIRFRERLLGLSLQEETAIAQELEVLLGMASAAEGEGKNWVEWAQECTELLNEKQSEDMAEPDALRLLNAHKSKGLGWEVVIVPFFFRKFSSKREYPLFFRNEDRRWNVALRSNDLSDESKSLIEQSEIEEEIRLLYVSLTRVKRTLILIDDEHWFKDLKGQRGRSFGEILNVGEKGLQTEQWKRWEKGFTDGGFSQMEVDESNAEFPQWRAKNLVDSQLLIKRVTPSSLQQHKPYVERDEPDRLNDPEFFEEIRVEDPADYGNWWHLMMEETPWDSSVVDWKIHFKKALESSPDIERGALEVERFLETDLIQKLSTGEWHCAVEVPFLWQGADATAYEGFIDFLAYHSKSDRWLVVDWKTDRLKDNDPIQALREMYQPQIKVYQDAIEAMYGNVVEAGMYATALGEWVAI